MAPETLPALLAEADEVIGSSVVSATDAKPEAASEEVDGDVAAEMAAGWCRTFAAVPRFGSTADYGLSGLAAAVVLSATPKYTACHPPPSHQHFFVATKDLLGAMCKEPCCLDCICEESLSGNASTWVQQLCLQSRQCCRVLFAGPK